MTAGVCAGLQGDGLGFMKVMALTRAQLDQISEEQKKHMEVRAARSEPAQHTRLQKLTQPVLSWPLWKCSPR